MTWFKKYHRECSHCGASLDKHLVLGNKCPQCPHCNEVLVTVNFFEIKEDEL